MHEKIVRDGEPKFNFGSPTMLRDAMLQYADCDLFRDSEQWTRQDSPYERELRPHVLKHFDFEQPMRSNEFLHYQSLAAHRLLLTIYESDFVLLPRRGIEGQFEKFLTFYSPERRALGQLIRPQLEHYLFNFLDTEIDVAGEWSEGDLKSYFEQYAKDCTETKVLPVIEAIENSADPDRALKTLCIQLAGDFLVESSAMARNIPGRYGQEQSELFKILIDEYGYGVHGRKHSTLFESLLNGLGLTQDVHDYWQFYLTSSLALNNFYNYLSANHSKYFRYIGATFQTETAFIEYCRQMAELLRNRYPQLDRAYFAEHAHIDGHHSRMAYENLVKPSVLRHGRKVIPEIIRGFEAARLLGKLADDDYQKQVQWMDDGQVCKRLHPRVYENLANADFPVPRQTFTEPRHELSVTHVHDGDELCHIERGVMHFVNGASSSVTLHEGEGTVIRKNRLHGAIIASPECVYTIHSVGDHEKWL